MGTAFACECGQIGSQRFKLAALCRFEQGDIQRQPGAVQLDQAIGRNLFFLYQQGGGFNQLGRTLARFARGHQHFIALLGGAVHASVVSAKFAFGQLQRLFAGYCAYRSLFDIDHRRRLGDRQQCGVVAHRRLQFALPVGA